MANFFSELVSSNLIQDWAETLDWLFDDNRFPKEKGWSSGHVGNFTKKVKKLEGLPQSNFKTKEFIFPNAQDHSQKFKYPLIYFKSNNGEGKDLIRHIRNGIAHGRTAFSKEHGVLFIEIIDFGKDTDSKKGAQTAYIYIPIQYILDMHKIYCSIEKSIVNDKSKNKNKQRRSQK